MPPFLSPAPSLKPSDRCCHHQIPVTIYLDPGVAVAGGVPWWVILLAVLAGILVLALLIFILWKVSDGVRSGYVPSLAVLCHAVPPDLSCALLFWPCCAVQCRAVPSPFCHAMSCHAFGPLQCHVVPCSAVPRCRITAVPSPVVPCRAAPPQLAVLFLTFSLPSSVRLLQAEQPNLPLHC